MKYLIITLAVFVISLNAHAFCPPPCKVTHVGPYVSKTSSGITTGTIVYQEETGLTIMKADKKTLRVSSVENSDGTVTHTYWDEDDKPRKVVQNKGESKEDYAKRAAKEIAESGKLDEAAAEKLIRKQMGLPDKKKE